MIAEFDCPACQHTCAVPLELTTETMRRAARRPETPECVCVCTGCGAVLVLALHPGKGERSEA
jgi:hypothetical protein